MRTPKHSMEGRKIGPGSVYYNWNGSLIRNNGWGNPATYLQTYALTTSRPEGQHALNRLDK